MQNFNPSRKSGALCSFSRKFGIKSHAGCCIYLLNLDFCIGLVYRRNGGIQRGVSRKGRTSIITEY